MAFNNMLTITVQLEQQPGGISPELHLKEGSTAVNVHLLLLKGKALVDVKQKYCVIRGIKPDGKELFLTSFSGLYDDRIQVQLYAGDVSQMASAAGTYRCTMTILNTTTKPTRSNYMNYDFLTVLPFTVIVHEKAGRDVSC